MESVVKHINLMAVFDRKTIMHLFACLFRLLKLVVKPKKNAMLNMRRWNDNVKKFDKEFERR